MMLKLYMVDVDKKAVTYKEISYEDYRRLVHPIFLTAVLETAPPYVLVAAHPAAVYDLPGVDALHVVVHGADGQLSYVRICSRYGSRLVRGGVAGILLYNIGKSVQVEIREDEVKLLEHISGKPALRISRDSVESDIEYIPNVNTKSEHDLYISINLVERTVAKPEPLIIRRVRYLMELSPLFSGPVKRDGLLALAKRLVGLELDEKILNILEKYTNERLCCSYCPAACLNKFSNVGKHVPLDIYDYMIDEQLRSLLNREDPYLTLALLYMIRMAYPEYVKDRAEFYFKLRRLYTGIILSGLCPLYIFHMTKSRDVELDLCQEFLRYISSLSIDLEYIASKIELSTRCNLHIDYVKGLYSDYISRCEEYVPVEEVPKLRRLRFPVVQLALDLVADYEVLDNIIRQCVNAGVKIVEIGTPLVKRYGTEIVQHFVELLKDRPDVVLFADTKTMDVGDLEARLMFLAGADMVAVLAVGVVDKILEALYEAVKFNKCVLVDLIQVEDPIGYIERHIELFRRYSTWLVLCVHRGITEQLRGRGIETDYELVKRLRGMLPEVVLAVAGGLRPGLLKKMREAGADILIVGAALYTSRNVYETARKLVEEVA